jgi:O-antigen/teichoic acid export membrane protein
MTSIGQKIVNSAAWTTVETWSRQTALFVAFILIAHLVGPEAFGLAALALVVPGILIVIVTKGLTEAIIQRPEIEREHLDSAFWLLVAVGIVLSILVWLSSGPVAAAFGKPVLADLVRLASPVVAIQALGSVPSAILQRQLAFRLLALRTLTGVVTGSVVGVGLAIAGYGVWSLIWMQLAKSAVEAGILVVASNWRPRLGYSHARCRELFPFAAPILGAALWAFVNDELPKVALGLVLGPHEVGVYTFARRILDFLTGMLVSPLTTLALPAASRVQNDPARANRFFDTSVRVTALVAFPIFMGVAATAPLAIPLVVGAQWESSVPVIQILMFVGLVRTVAGVCAAIVVGLGFPGLILKLCLAYSLLGAFLFPAAAHVSIEATMVAIVACNAALLPVLLLWTSRLARIDVLRPLAIFPPLMIATALMAAAVIAWLLLSPRGIPEAEVLAVAIALGAVTYGVAALVLIRPDLLVARDMLLKMRR